MPDEIYTKAFSHIAANSQRFSVLAFARTDTRNRFSFKFRVQVSTRIGHCVLYMKQLPGMNRELQKS
jgi:hypothetical protein